MSRGEGRIQKAILKILASSNNHSAVDLTAFVYQITGEQPITRLQTVQRAIKRLLEDGKIVESPWRNDKGDRCFSLPGGARRAIKGKLSAVKGGLET